MNNNVKRDRNCLVVYRDEPERIIQEEMLQCFNGMYIWPMYVNCDNPEVSSPELTREEIEGLLSRNPGDKSIWLRDDAGAFVMVNDGSQSSGNDPLADFYQSEVLKRLTSLTSMLQYIGVKSYEVHANEEVSNNDVGEESKAGAVSTGWRIIKTSASGSASTNNTWMFAQKINRGFKFSQTAHRHVTQIDISDIRRRIERAGLGGTHILETLIQSVKDGEESWSGFEVEEMIAADVSTQATNKLDVAAQVSFKLAIFNGNANVENHANIEQSRRTIQSLMIKISNR